MFELRALGTWAFSFGHCLESSRGSGGFAGSRVWRLWGVEGFVFRVGFGVEEFIWVVVNQNDGPFWGTLNNRCRIIIRTQKGTIILTTTYIKGYEQAMLNQPLHSEPRWIC